MPIGFVGGIDSVERRQAGQGGATKRLVGKFFSQITGDHLFPMEAPELSSGNDTAND